jgi:hypothetical protein
LYEDFGFEREGLRRRHYLRDGAAVDALLMAYHLPSAQGSLHLERPDQEAAHLRLVTRVEQGVASHHPAGVADGLDQLCDRGTGLGPPDGSAIQLGTAPSGGASQAGDH